MHIIMIVDDFWHCIGWYRTLFRIIWQARLGIRTYGGTHSSFLTDLSEAVDVYGDWIDACESVN